MKKFFLLIPSLLIIGCASADPAAETSGTEQDLIGRDCSNTDCLPPSVCKMQGSRPVCVPDGPPFADPALAPKFCERARCPAGTECVDNPDGRSGQCVKTRAACELPITRGGPCLANITRYGFDAAAGKCIEFKYAGCGGNANNFTSLTECQKLCEAPPTTPCATVLCAIGQCVVDPVTGGPTCVPIPEPPKPRACDDLNCKPRVEECRVDGEAYCQKLCLPESCPHNQKCVLEKVVCVKAPCPLIPTCVDDPPRPMPSNP